MRNRLAAIAALTLLALPFAQSAQAIPTNVDPETWYGFKFGVQGSALESGAGAGMPSNPAGIEAPDPTWRFVLSEPGYVIFADIWSSSDQFEIHDDGALLGTTSAPTPGGDCESDLTCALGDTRYSRGVFLLDAGVHALTGIVLLGEYGSGAFYFAEGAAPDVAVPNVPVPAALGLQGAVLGLGAGLAWLRRRRAA